MYFTFFNKRPDVNVKNLLSVIKTTWGLSYLAITISNKIIYSKQSGITDFSPHSLWMPIIIFSVLLIIFSNLMSKVDKLSNDKNSEKTIFTQRPFK